MQMWMQSRTRLPFRDATAAGIERERERATSEGFGLPFCVGSREGPFCTSTSELQLGVIPQHSMQPAFQLVCDA